MPTYINIPKIKPSLKNVATNDPYVYIYTYPEFTPWALDDTGRSIDPSKVADIQAVFLSTHPMLYYNEPEFTTFKWVVYANNNHLHYISTLSGTSFRLGDPAYTISYAGRTFTNEHYNLSRILMATDPERLAYIHFARYGRVANLPTGLGF